MIEDVVFAISQSSCTFMYSLARLCKCFGGSRLSANLYAV